MAGASMIDIKSRIKSVQSTMQITKAMELVATSKLRRAKEKVERTRPFYEALRDAISTVVCASNADSTVWTKPSEEKKTLYIAIAGDRGLAGGYNSNIFKLTEKLAAESGGEYAVLPIGKKAVEYYKHRESEIYTDEISLTSDIGVGDSLALAEKIANDFNGARFDKVVLVYTKFVSMISQTPVYEELLPLTDFGERDASSASANEPLYEGEAEEMLLKIVPAYIGGILYSAVCEALASESGARRSSMNAANKNASEIIDTLMLKYNRARQAVITQEITEIVSGAEAL